MDFIQLTQPSLKECDVMKRMRKVVVDVIRKPSSQRTPIEIISLLPWLRGHSSLFQRINTDTLCEIIRQCSYERVTKDTVIVKQDEMGECFYVIIDGSVGVYITENPGDGDDDHTDHDDWEDDDDEGEESDDDHDDHDDGFGSRDQSRDPSPDQSEEAEVTPLKPLTFKQIVCGILNRKKFGKRVTTLNAGDSFGEMALLKSGSERLASVVSDEVTQLLVVRRDLYRATIGEYQERDYAERMDFVQNHVFFRKWTMCFKRMLVASLVKHTYTFDTPIVTQGEVCNGLVFLTSGNARIVVDPRKHETQYPKLALAATTSRVRIGRHADGCPRPLGRAERCQALKGAAIKDRMVLCHVQSGETIGDLEFTTSLATHAHSVICASQVDVYRLNARNASRLLRRAVPATLRRMRELVERKIVRRVSSVPGSAIALYRKLLVRLHDASAQARARRLRSGIAKMAPVALVTRKRLPDKETLFLQQLQLYAQDKAILSRQYVEGGIYYREMAREKAQDRNRRRQRGETLAKRFAHKLRQKARTSQALRAAAAAEQQTAQRAAENERSQATDGGRNPLDDVVLAGDAAVAVAAANGTGTAPAPPGEQSGTENASVPNEAGKQWQQLRDVFVQLMANRRAREDSLVLTSYDWETSDKSLDYLEKRMLQFNSSNGNNEPYVGLPKLKRFESQEDQRPPRPGGKVMVQRHRCKTPVLPGGIRSQPPRARPGQVRHHMLRHLPNYDHLWRTKAVTQLVADRQRAHWIESHANG